MPTRCKHGIPDIRFCSVCTPRPKAPVDVPGPGAPPASGLKWTSARMADKLLSLFKDRAQWSSADLVARLQADAVPNFWQFSQGIYRLRQGGFSITTVHLGGTDYAYRMDTAL